MLKKGKRRNEQKKSTLDSKSVLKIALSIFLAFLVWGGAVAFESYILSDKDVTTAVVAKKDIKAGTYIDENNRSNYFMTESVNSKLTSGKTLTNVDAVEGKVTTDIYTGEIVTESRLSNTKTNLDKISDPYLVSFGVSDASSAANGYIRKGDLVDVIAANTSDAETPAQFVAKDAYIVQAYDESYNAIPDNDTTTKAVFFDIYIESDAVDQFVNDIAKNDVSVVKKVLTEKEQ